MPDVGPQVAFLAVRSSADSSLEGRKLRYEMMLKEVGGGWCYVVAIIVVLCCHYHNLVCWCQPVLIAMYHLRVLFHA